jgi:hypothetical protein
MLLHSHLFGKLIGPTLRSSRAIRLSPGNCELAIFECIMISIYDNLLVVVIAVGHKIHNRLRIGGDEIEL